MGLSMYQRILWPLNLQVLYEDVSENSPFYLFNVALLQETCALLLNTLSVHLVAMLRQLYCSASSILK